MAGNWNASARAQDLFPLKPEAGEDLFHYLQRTNGAWSQKAYRKLLGAANAFKEGDEIVGVAAPDEQARQAARRLLEATPLSQIDAHPPFEDALYKFIAPTPTDAVRRKLASMTLSDLKRFLLDRPEEEIHAIKDGLSSDVIACVVRLMDNNELIQVGAKVFNPLPGSHLGAKGYMGARIQPNSPTDHVDDIRWQVFSAFSYAVGDLLIGTNPVSSTPDAVASVEAALQEILVAFELTDVLPHCVLAHIDVQAEVESRKKGLTELWFQSIAGNDAANQTFDLTIDKMVEHAKRRTGRFGLYFETGQGADFTNGHAHGTDMVIHESRKYGFARALSRVTASALAEQGVARRPWLHLNDVAGFIGPEVFRTREQLVRCCLEDIVMGKLHGLMIGLDICSTLHMDVTLDDLTWCTDQVMPANPGYLMALPTRIDPMLGYLTTSFQDHVRIREKFGYKVDDRMWRFFQRLGVIDADGKPTPQFGDPAWVYLQYRRRKADPRSDAEIYKEAPAQIDEVRARGVFIAQGYGEKPSDLEPKLAKHIRRIYDDAKRAIWKEFDSEFLAAAPHAKSLQTRSEDRLDYILHPQTGERLSDRSAALVDEYRATLRDEEIQIVVSDGLNALAVMEADQAWSLVRGLRLELAKIGRKVAETNLLVEAGRVRAGYRIGERLFGGKPGRYTILHIIGERPGSGHQTLSIYMTVADGQAWGTPDTVDHNITKVVSGIAVTALAPQLAAVEAVKILGQM